MTPSDFFSPDYSTARNRFRKLVQDRHGALTSLLLDAKGPAGEELAIDIGWFGEARPRRVLLHSSGVHGVEAFAGSAVQLQFLTEMPQPPPDTALVSVHVLNPFGMAWLRRFNENNVDLNRNFLGADEPYSGAPEAYAKLDSILNPTTPPSADFFLLRAIGKILRYGMPALRQAVAGGQYEFPQGLFFGGKRLEQGPNKFSTFVSERLSSADRVIAIDVHTGLGQSGEDTLLVEEKSAQALRQMFGERVAPLDPERSLAYRARGDIHFMLYREIRGRVDFACQEFGTVGPLRIINSLREENRWHHYGGGSVDHPSKRNLRQVFSPMTEHEWCRKVLARGKSLIERSLEILASDAR